MSFPMGDLFKRPVAKRTRSQRKAFFEEEYRRVWGNNGGTDESVRGSPTPGGFVNQGKIQAREVVRESSYSESSTEDSDEESSSDSGDDVVEIRDKENDENEELEYGSDDIVELREIGRNRKHGAFPGVETKKLDKRKCSVVDFGSSNAEDSGPRMQKSEEEENVGHYEFGASSGVKKMNLDKGKCVVDIESSSTKDSGPSVEELVAEENGVDKDAEGWSSEESNKKHNKKRKYSNSRQDAEVRGLTVDATSSSDDEDDEEDDTEDEDWVAESTEEGVKRGREFESKVVNFASSSESGDLEEDDEDSESSDEDILEIIETRIKRKRVSKRNPAAHGLKISRTSARKNCIAKRTRAVSGSHFRSSSSPKNKLHCCSGALQFDDNEDGENIDDDESNETDDCIGEGDMEGAVGEEIGGEKRVNIEDPSIFDVFVKKIWENAGEHREEKVVPKPDVVKALPLKFNYGVEKPKPVEKSKNDKLIEELWNEMEFVLAACGAGSFEASKVTREEPNEPINESDQSLLCIKGKHDFVLNEQIGIICRSCSLVKTEIKYVAPRVDTICCDRSARKTFANDWDSSMWEVFDFDNAGDDSLDSYVGVAATVWDMFPRLRENLYPHQQEGLEFLWRNVAGGIDVDNLKKSSHSDSIGGCVVSHAPGTGKTLLTIAFLQSYMEVFKECRPVIIAPCSMLLTWEDEFKKWKSKLSFHNLNSRELSGKEDNIARELIRGRGQPNKLRRLVTLYSWSKGKSVLGISYNLFEQLSGTRFMDEKTNKSQNNTQLTKEDKEISRILLGKPSLLVLDEGHTPRNTSSLIWKALKMMKTEKRIILSGTPFQNNFEELYNTLSLVRPKFLGSISSSKIQKTSLVDENKDARGKWALLTNSIGKDADNTLLEKIRTMLNPFVHIHKGSILKDNLPGLMDCLVVLDCPPLQKSLLEKIQTIKNNLELEHAICLVSIHPSLLVHCGSSAEKRRRPRKGTGCSVMKSGGFNLDEFKAKGSEMEKLMAEEFKLDPRQGVKIWFLMELLRLSEVTNEKVLVFCQFTHPFDLIKSHLIHHFKWTEGEEVLQMDGKDNMKQRQSMINLFNDPSSKVRVLLASTRACREGISLIGASRIVLLDVVWNPSVERQAISRAYRLGQKKMVYTYHLISSGTMEGDKYRKQVLKDRISELVFTATGSHGEKGNVSSTIHEDAIMEEMIKNEKLKGIFKEVIYQPKESDMDDTFI